MHIGYFIIHSKNLVDITEYLKIEMEFKFQSIEPEHVVLINETYYLRNDGYQSNIIILKKRTDNILVDVIGTGGEIGGIFSLVLGGSESSFVQAVKQVLTTFAIKNNIIVQEQSLT
jgi:hydroxyethylthiazole kinase-like sugar kinase family protein